DTEGEKYFSDARTIDPSELGDFDLITAGFPCQPYADISVIPIKKRKCA
ncbi:MAG: DNA cytosine methyltransferase, partial [Ruminococcus sp.]|nr:DNA cytosine methyltransferase [Ruminococcus sp.]